MRHAPGRRAARRQDVIAAIRRHVAGTTPAREVTFGASMEPHADAAGEPGTPRPSIRGARAGLGEDPLLTPRLGGSLPIAEFGDALDIPCYGIPLANADERNHAPNENMEVDRFLRGITGAAGVLLALGGAL